MKNILIFFILLISFNTYSQKKAEQVNKYFDKDYNQINEKKFEKIKNENRLLRSIQGNSINHKILSNRENFATLQNKHILDSLLTSATNKKVDSSKTMVIIFYPGKTPCNSSGTVTKGNRKAWHRKLERKIFKITQTKPIYIYKDKEGIEKYDGIMTWYKDPNKTIQKLFFNSNSRYQCGSFVVISKKGEFISHFNEYPRYYVWKAAEILTKK